VNGGTAATSGPGDDRPRCEASVSGRRYHRGAKLWRAGTRPRGSLLRSRPKRDEPQGRYRVQNPEAVKEEEAVEVVRNHEDGT